jgi:hypothetical protein
MSGVDPDRVFGKPSHPTPKPAASSDNELTPLREAFCELVVASRMTLNAASTPEYRMFMERAGLTDQLPRTPRALRRDLLKYPEKVHQREIGRLEGQRVAIATDGASRFGRNFENFVALTPEEAPVFVRMHELSVADSAHQVKTAVEVIGELRDGVSATTFVIESDNASVMAAAYDDVPGAIQEQTGEYILRGRCVVHTGELTVADTEKADATFHSCGKEGRRSSNPLHGAP